MAAPLLPPNPCLVAILLIVNYHHQPRLVFHYPPKPGEDNSRFRTYLSDDLSESDSSSSSEDESASSDSNQSSADHHKDDRGGNLEDDDVDLEELGSASPEKLNGMAQMKKPLKWNDIFGVEAGNLAKLLSPAPSNHKKRFEMTLDEKAFLGWPVFSKDGHWRKKKHRKSRSADDSLQDNSTEKKNPEDSPGQRASDAVTELDDTSEQDTERDERNEGGVSDERAPSKRPASKAGSGKPSHDRFKGAQSGDEDHLLDTLQMFHVVFVLDPPPLEYHLRMKEMYDHVVKKFSRALRWEQAKSNYVSKEASTIAAAKSIGKALSKNLELLLEEFEEALPLILAVVDQPLAPIYHQMVSQSSLAKAISTLFHSISDSKIAQIHLTPTLSLSLQIPIPTSTSILPSPIAPQLPGLWLTTANSLPTDDDVDTTTSQLASHFTLLLLFDLSTILTDINATASPLTEPLTHYLQASKPTKSFLQISQTCGISLRDIQFLASHLIYWRRARAIPPLNQRDTYIMSPNADMQNLSSATSSFAKRFPTLPSLPRMLHMLSYTPRPYSAIIPSKEHKETYLDMLAWLLRDGWVTQLRTYAWVRVPTPIILLPNNQPQPQPQPPTPKTPIIILTNPDLPPPTTTTSNHLSPPSSPPSPCPLLIPSPREASGPQAAQLSALSQFVLAHQGPETQSAWEKCIRYFDGRHALETIAVREGWKRKYVADLVAAWLALGVLLQARFW